MTGINLQPELTGQTLRLRPLKPEDFEGLYLAASDPLVWEMHPDSQRYKRDVFQQRFFDGAIASGGALAIEELDTARIIGSSRYYEWDAETTEIAIGYTFIARDHWGIGTNTELKDLMLGYIYQWASAVWFHVGKDNIRSRKAVEKLGAVLTHDEQRELDGKSFIQLYYKLTAPN